MDFIIRVFEFLVATLTIYEGGRPLKFESTSLKKNIKKEYRILDATTIPRSLFITGDRIFVAIIFNKY